MVKLEAIGTSALVSAIVAGGISYLTANWVDQNSKVRGARLEQIVRFTSSTDTFLSSANSYIAAFAYNKDAQPLQEQLGAEVNKQFSESEKLKVFFSSPEIQRSVDKYQEDLITFHKVVGASHDAQSIGSWTVQFGKVNDARLALTEQLKKSAGVSL
jgi:hypothetical protein